MIWSTYHSRAVKEKYLFKFLSIANLDLFLKTGSIWFSRADIFGDKMECVRIADLLEDKPDYQQIINRQQRYLISCWHLADKESLVLWDTYSDTVERRRTFAVRFRREDLLRKMNDFAIKNSYGSDLFHTTQFIHGKVQYRDLIGADTGQIMDTAVKYISFRKEAAFRYENEYRFVIKLDIDHPSIDAGRNYQLTDAKDLAFKIIINPLLNKEAYLSHREYVESAGFTGKLIESELNKWLHPELW